MTRKDYILIAETLRKAFEVAQSNFEQTEPSDKLDRAFCNGTVNGILESAENIAQALVVDNPGFDRVHFLAVVRGEKELTSKPQSKPSCCISDGCGRSFDPNMEETRPHETLRPFWMRYCHRHRVTGKLYPAIVEKTQ